MWQPIDTAPKDKSILLHIDGSIIEGEWREDLKKWKVIVLEVHGCGCCSSDDPPPSHWMPLPDLPGA